MSVPRPQVRPPSRAEILPALQALGLPTPLRLRPLGHPWIHVNYVLEFGPDSGVPPLMLRRQLFDPGYDTLGNELAALTLLQVVDEVPAVREYRILQHLPWRGALSQLLPGTQGLAVLRQQPQLGDALTALCGQVMATLEDLPQSGWGTAADQGRFVRQRGSWKEEWRALLLQYDGVARAAGTDLGPLSDALLERALADIDALDTLESWSLVHGDMHPSNLLFDVADAPRLTGIVDWEGAMLGDPLIEWCLHIEAAEGILARILRGYGRDRAATMLEPDRLARLRVYYYTRCLRRLAYLAGDLFVGEGGRRRTWAAQSARRVALLALGEPDYVKRRLEQALDETRPAGTPVRFTTPAHRLLQRTLDAVRFNPGLGRLQAIPFCGAAAVGLLAAQHDPSGQEEAWTAMGEGLADRLGPQRLRHWQNPIDDRIAWRDELAASVVDEGGRHLAATALWMAAASLDVLAEGQGWPVSDQVLRGVETFVRALHAYERNASSSLSVIERAMQAILGLAAATHFADAWGLEMPLDALRAGLAEAVEDAMVEGAEPSEVDLDAILAVGWPGEPPGSEIEALVPTVLYAIRELEVDRPRVLGAIGL